MMNRRDCIFYAEVVKGYIIKTVIDVLVGSFNRTCFSVTQDGISLRECDKNRSILFNIELFREKFKKYKCDESIYFSANVKHMQRLIRNLKKKDSLVLGIRKEAPDMLCIMICPARKPDNTNYRMETADIRIQIETHPNSVELPSSSLYKYPYVIDAAEFQKVKRIATVAKTIRVVIRGDNYLGFLCDKEIYSTALHFGDPRGETFQHAPVSEGRPAASSNPEAQNDLGEDPEDDETDDAEEDSESERSDTSSLTENHEDTFYSADFHSALFNHLVKLPGLCSQMQFYAPTEPLWPLRIRMEAGLLGNVEVYVKDMRTLEYDELDAPKEQKRTR